MNGIKAQIGFALAIIVSTTAAFVSFFGVVFSILRYTAMAILTLLCFSSVSYAELTQDEWVEFVRGELFEAQHEVGQAYDATAGKRAALQSALDSGNHVLAEQLVDELNSMSDTISFKQGTYYQRYVTYENYAKTKWGTTLKQLFRFKGVPLPGYLDYVIAVAFFRETVSHDGLPYALAEVGAGALDDATQVVAYTLMGGVITSTAALMNLQIIAEEVEAWKDKVRAAMALTDHSKWETRAAFLTADIDGMKETLAKFQDDEDAHQGEAQDTIELEMGIFELERVRDAYHFYGDVTGDGKIDEDDAEIIDEHWGQSVPVGTNGDINEDGLVNFSDWLIVSDRYGLSIY